jgi:hypothetical protein
MKIIIMVLYGAVLAIFGGVFKDDTLKIMSHTWVVGALIIASVTNLTKGEG